MQRSLLVLLVCASYLLFAGGPEWTAVPLLLLAAGVGLADPRRTFAFPRTDRPLDLSLVVIAAGLLLQSVPLPRAVVAVLSPRSPAIQESLNFMPLGATPAWQSLSIDAGASFGALGTFTLGILTFWAARGVFSGRRGTRKFCQALAVIGGVAAVVAIVQRQIEPELVLGTLRTSTTSASPFGAFVNRNHFAGWLLMIVAPVAGYLLAHANVHPEYRRSVTAAAREALRTGSLLTILATLISAGTIFLTLSRSAVAGLGAGLAGGWWLVRSRLDLRRQGSPVLFVVAAAGIVMLLVFVDTDKWVARISSSFERAPVGASAGRLTIWRETAPIIRDFAITGTGAGTFADAMTVYQRTRLWVGSMGKWTHFNSAHSHYLELVAEGGLLLTVPTVLGVWWLSVIGKRAMAADRSHIYWVRAGAAAGLIAVAVQSIWEVPLVMPANAVLAAVLAALVVHERPHDGMATPRPASANERA